jgi:hypothetical protein
VRERNNSLAWPKSTDIEQVIGVLSRIQRRVDKLWFNWRCNGIYKTPPVQCDPDGKVLVVSQLHHPDMTMYMLAAKSFARYLRPREFVIVDDGLRAADRDTLRAHFSRIRFVRSAEIDTGSCPSRGCWERLLTLSHENASHYAIQLDSDTLTLGEPSEVQECVAQDRTFTLGTLSGTHVVGLDEASAYAHSPPSEHVQNHAERALGRYPGKEALKYVRGCAGFAGFAKGHLGLKAIEDFSENMQALVGREKWGEWGSEQVTSNFIAANAPDCLVLPVERYPFWKSGMDLSRAVLVHFFGTFRFTEGMYARQARQIVKELSK